jgi:hypothetical protein
MLRREMVHVAMKSDMNVALFEKFVAIIPEVVNIDMGHAGDPLSYAVGSHLREA